jgi:hypothetical protein
MERAASDTWELAATVWQWEGGNWFFLTVPEDVSDEIAEATEGRSGGFGSVRVEVTCGATTWLTSLFPSRTAQAYVLPIKKAVRTAEHLEEGDRTQVRLRLTDA